jgi:hypothetical protein
MNHQRTTCNVFRPKYTCRDNFERFYIPKDYNDRTTYNVFMPKDYMNRQLSTVCSTIKRNVLYTSLPLRRRVSPQSTYTYRAPQCMSPCRNWDSPTPLAASECALPPGPKGGRAHSPAAQGVGESQFLRLEKKLSTLPTL